MKGIGEREEKFIRENIGEMTLEDIAKTVGFSRQAVTNAAIRLGVYQTKKRIENLTDEELKTVYDLRQQRFTFSEIAATIQRIYGKKVSERTLKNRYYNGDDTGRIYRQVQIKIDVTEDDMRDAEKYQEYLSFIKEKIHTGVQVMSIVRMIDEYTQRPIMKNVWFTVMQKYPNQVLVRNGSRKECLMYTDIKAVKGEK